MQYLPLIIVVVLFFIMFYFLTIRPLRQREKKHDEMIEQLNVGDLVITASGIYGEVTAIQENSVTLKIEDGAIKVTKGAIMVRPEL